MNNRNRGFLTGMLTLMLVALTSLPAAVSAQRGRRRAARQERREALDESQLKQTAKTVGYKSGKQAGMTDRQRGETFNFRDEKEYQQATKGYSPKLGDEEHYKAYLRQAFENGYRDGWNGY